MNERQIKLELTSNLRDAKELYSKILQSVIISSDKYVKAEDMITKADEIFNQLKKDSQTN